MLVTVERYRSITRDDSTPASAVEEQLERAEEELAEALDRPLADGTYIERMTPTRDGWLWPRATPLLAAPGHTINGVGLEPAHYHWPHDHHHGHCHGPVEVTYTGGWVERSANPTAVNRLPICIEDDLAWAAHGALVVPDAEGIDIDDIPEGATSARLGDAAVGFGGDGAPGSRPGSERGGRKWSRRTLSYRYSVIRGI